MSYRVKIDAFEGPFDLLVYLIEHARMSIYDIRISEITQQYMEYLARMQEEDFNLAAEFVVLAAELLEIKSKMLLPRTNTEEPTEETYEDPRTELVQKLREYKKYKAIAAMLEERREYASTSMEKPQEDLAQYTNEPDEFLVLDSQQFKTAFESFLRRRKKIHEIKAHHIRSEKQKITTELKMASIEEFFREIPVGQRHDFKELLKDQEDRYDISVTFSSVLEMMKSRSIDAEQKRLFGEIEVYSTGNIQETQNMQETEDARGGN